jgi:UDP-N-acetylglucosamine 2-epimerase (non-hydrolysing)
MAEPRILSVVGTRPNFMKVAPLHRALEARGGFRSRVVHTGQHYDERMSHVFFEQLGLPEPHAYLGVGSGSHGEQLGRIMVAFERLLEHEPVELVVVVGDVNSTLACSLVAARAGIPVAHVEAGLRSFDRSMPEEINRVITDQISDWLFVTEQSGLDNLKAEGIPDQRGFFVGNLMIDTLVSLRGRAAATRAREGLDIGDDPYVLVTLHRPSNVDTEESLERVVELLDSVAREATVVFPVHPRTAERLGRFGLESRLRGHPRMRLLEPLGYLEFLDLMEHAGAVLTDSGGIQEETTFLGVPCLTLRENTERPSTLEAGTNELVTLEPDEVVARVRWRLNGGAPTGPTATIPLWDGRAAERVVDVLERVLQPLLGPLRSVGSL